MTDTIATALLINASAALALWLVNRVTEKQCRMYAEEARRFFHATNDKLAEIQAAKKEDDHG